MKKLLSLIAAAALTVSCSADPDIYRITKNIDTDSFKMKLEDGSIDHLVHLACVKTSPDKPWAYLGRQYLTGVTERTTAKAGVGTGVELDILEERPINHFYAVVQMANLRSYLDKSTQILMGDFVNDEDDLQILQVQLLVNGLAITDFNKNTGCEPYIELFTEAQIRGKAARSGFWAEHWNSGEPPIKFTDD